MDRVAIDEGRVHHPIEEDAAPLPADRGHQETQERRVGHVPTAASRRMTAVRRRLTNRVHQVGFVITFTS